VSSVIEKFRAKYGDEGVKLYSKLELRFSPRRPENARIAFGDIHQIA
jgi:hypothetical protein